MTKFAKLSNPIVEILMRRDGLSESEAWDLFDDAVEALKQYLEEKDIESAENICQEFFSLEPDYLDYLW